MTRPLVLVSVRTQVLNPMVSTVFASTVKVASTAILNRFVCSFVRSFVTFKLNDGQMKQKSAMYPFFCSSAHGCVSIFSFVKCNNKKRAR